ncbi:MAG: T9SS type A sorting domain-containing protein [Phycisphaerae bacterium]|nr:T9SS type A sorting domain-containing protein [Saprospiraceae bacterium]
MRRSTNLALAFVFAVFQAYATTRYVTPGGAGAMNGTSWANAYPGTSLQTAINNSASGDQVWVAAGTYKPTNGTSRTIYFGLKTGVEVYGSFVGNETALSERNIDCGPSSILSAEIGNGGNADNSYHVISNTNVGSTAVLDGFVVSDGNANFDNTGNDPRSLGGGMLNAGNAGGLASPTVQNCVFTNNSAFFGGGIFNHGQNNGNANPVVSHCIFYANNATGGGGGIDNFGYNGNASPTLTNCIFAENTATDRAGAMYCWGGGGGNASPVILNCSFVNNSSVDGGAIVADRSNFSMGNSGNADPNVRNSIFWGNTASGEGPQFYLIGGATFTATYSDIDLAGQDPPHIISGPGTGNIEADPQFLNDTDLDGADDCWMTTDDGLHVDGGSPCVDAGNNPGVPTGDLKFYERIGNGTVDMGVYEFESSPLPIDLLAFYGKAENGFNQLFWTTASEMGNRHFEIQRSFGGLGFETIGTVPGAGNSQTMLQYTFTDDKLLSPAYYYRLKQEDFDGKQSFSPLIFLKSKNALGGLTYSNPVGDVLAVQATNEVFDNETFFLFDSRGAVVRSVLADGDTFSIEMIGVQAGVYFLKNSKTARVYKIVKAN